MSKKNIIQTLLIIIVTAAFAFYIKKNFHNIKEAITIKPYFLVLLVLLNMANKVFNGFNTKRILRLFNIKLTFKEWFGMSCVNNFYNYLAPKSGTAACGVYLNNKYNLDYHKYLGVLITTGLITVFTSGVVGFVVSLFSGLPHRIDTMIFLALFFGMMAGPLILFLIPRIRLPGQGLSVRINEFFEGWEILRKDLRTIMSLSFMNFLVILSMAARYFILFRIFSMQATFTSCILIAPFSIITHFATIVPGAYGIKEVAVGAVSTLTNISFAAGALATLSDRIIMMTLTFILGPIFSFVLLKHSFVDKKPVARLPAGKPAGREV